MEAVFIFFATGMSGLMCIWWNKQGALNLALKTLMGAQAFMGGYLIYTMRLLGA